MIKKRLVSIGAQLKGMWKETICVFKAPYEHLLNKIRLRVDAWLCAAALNLMNLIVCYFPAAKSNIPAEAQNVML